MAFNTFSLISAISGTLSAPKVRKAAATPAAP